MTKTRIGIVLSSLFIVGFLVLSSSVAEAALTRGLSSGSVGADVSELQAFLAEDASLYPEGIVSGYFGPLTRQAVIRFQAQNGIATVGLVGPQTRAAINAQMQGGTGGSDDINAPTIVPTTVSIVGNIAEIRWVTNEPTFGRIMYGTSWPFLFATAPRIQSGAGFGTSHVVTLGSLPANNAYYYVIEAEDIAGNISYTLSQSITTTQ